MEILLRSFIQKFTFLVLSLGSIKIAEKGSLNSTKLKAKLSNGEFESVIMSKIFKTSEIQKDFKAFNSFAKLSLIPSFLKFSIQYTNFPQILYKNDIQI